MKHDVDDKSDTRMMRHLVVLFLISCALSSFGGTAANSFGVHGKAIRSDWLTGNFGTQ